MQALEERLEDIRTPMDVSVIGCKVNGRVKQKLTSGLLGLRLAHWFIVMVKKPFNRYRSIG